MADKKSSVMRTKVYSPFKVYFDGSASSISASNKIGPFDILPHHRNFITLLQSGNLVVRSVGKDDFVLKISRGIMHVKSDEVKVFLDV